MSTDGIVNGRDHERGFNVVPIISSDTEEIWRILQQTNSLDLSENLRSLTNQDTNEQDALGSRSYALTRLQRIDY